MIVALNVDKTNFVIFHSHARKLNEPIALKFGRKKILQADHVRFLGLLLDETRGWKPHLVELFRKPARSVGIFYKLRYHVPLDTLKCIMHFSSFFTYGIGVWGSTFENLLNPVRVAHKKVLRAMTFSDPTAYSSPLFYDLKILELDDLHQLSISVFAYECQNNIAPLYFVNFFTQTTDVYSYNTRSAARGDFFILQRNTLQYGLQSIHFNGAKIWNSIPPEIRDASSVRTFKNNLKNLYFDSYIS